MNIFTLNEIQKAISSSKNEMVSVQIDNETVLMMSPEVLEDYIDGILAMEADKEGYLTPEESQGVLNKYRKK